MTAQLWWLRAHPCTFCVVLLCTWPWYRWCSEELSGIHTGLWSTWPWSIFSWRWYTDLSPLISFRGIYSIFAFSTDTYRVFVFHFCRWFLPFFPVSLCYFCSECFDWNFASKSGAYYNFSRGFGSTWCGRTCVLFYLSLLLEAIRLVAPILLDQKVGEVISVRQELH